MIGVLVRFAYIIEQGAWSSNFRYLCYFAEKSLLKDVMVKSNVFIAFCYGYKHVVEDHDSVWIDVERVWLY